jgi:hypothetical protein
MEIYVEKDEKYMEHIVNRMGYVWNMGISSIYIYINIIPSSYPPVSSKVAGWEIPEIDEGLVRWENHPTKYFPAGV